MNELLLIGSIFVIYGLLFLFYRLFGKSGLYVWSGIATIMANIEVLILVKAFGMDMTLGNILFASTFLATDILSEMHGKKAAQKAANIGIVTSAVFLFVSQSWLWYQPSVDDWAHSSISTLFANTPRIMLSSLLVFAIVQRFDVWAYHKWWNLTVRKFGDTKRFLWLRNNGSTLISQLINAILYTFLAFWELYDFKTLVSIAASSYVIFIVTSLADTPFVYLARKVKIPEEV